MRQRRPLLRPRYGVLIGFLLLILPACSSASAGTSTAGTSTATTIASTATPAGPAEVTGAYLGGRESDFEAAFGAPTSTSGNRRTFATTIQGQPVVVGLILDVDAPTGRAKYLTVNPGNGVTWDNTTALTIASTFSPHDAQANGTQVVSNFGLEYLYMSVLLANSFPASEHVFVNGAGQSVPSGTYYIACHTHVTPQGCAMSTGE